MALWPNNYSTAVGWNQYRHFGIPTLYRYKYNGGSTRNIYVGASETNNIPKHTAVPDGYSAGGAAVMPFTAGGMSRWNEAIVTLEGAGNLLSGGPMEGTGTLSIQGDNNSLSLVVSLEGTSTISFSGDGLVLRLTVGLDGTGAFSITGDANVLSLIVPFEGTGSVVSLTGTSDLRGLLDLEGDFSASAGTMTNESIAEAVWNALAADFSTPGTMGVGLKIVEKILRNKTTTNPSTGVMTVYDDDGSSVLFQGQVYEDVAGSQTYRGQGADRKDRLT